MQNTDKPSFNIEVIQNDEVTLNSLMNQAGEAIAFANYDWVVQYCNDAYLKGLGLTRGDVIGKTPFEYHPGFERSIFFEMMDFCAKKRQPISKIGYSTIVKRWLMVRVIPLAHGALMLANDATENVIKQYHLAAEAVKDQLTGLPNNLALINQAENLIKEGKHFSVMTLGLDRFRNINDAMGHSGGDMVLLETSSRLQSATKTHETLYRLRADEFAILSTQDADGIIQRFNQFKQATETPILLHGHSFALSASAGVSLYPADGSDPDELLKRAGLALRQSKNSGRGKLSLYASELESETQLRLEIESELRSAIKNRELHLVFQPKGDIASGRINGAEALIRWNHKSRGFLSPAAFLPIAEDCHLMKEIDGFVLKEALSTISEWRRRGLEYPISINLSIDSLCDHGLIARVKDALQESETPPHLLEVEIPEGTLMSDFNSSIEILNQLREMGVRISVDDFGTGYSSLSYLARFPIHTLKIDRSLIIDINENITNQKIVRAIIQMAHSLQLDVVAEGVETEMELKKLKRNHCDTVQGYFFARPMSSDKFIEFALAQSENQGATISAISI